MSLRNFASRVLGNDPLGASVPETRPTVEDDPALFRCRSIHVGACDCVPQNDSVPACQHRWVEEVQLAQRRCSTCGEVETWESRASRHTYTGYPLPDVARTAPTWAEPLAPPAPWGRHLT